MIKVIVFDFDDTLVLSESLKKSTWFKIFKNKKQQDFLKEYLSKYNFHRKLMLKNILVNFNKSGLLKSKVNQEILLKKYNQVIFKDVMKAKEAKDVEKILAKLSKKYGLYVNSATTHEEMVKIIKAKKWGKYFKRVLGSPPGTKMNNAFKIFKKEKVLPREVLVVGDGLSDKIIAEDFGFHFIGIATEMNKWQGKNVINFNHLNKIFNFL